MSETGTNGEEIGTKAGKSGTAKRRKTGGRTPDLTPELINKIVPLMQQGHIIATVCLAIGISESAFYKWKKRGIAKANARDPKPADAIYVQFVEAIKSARALLEVKLISHLQTSAANGNARACAWLLERLFPERYRRSIGVTGAPDGVPIPIDAPAPIISIVVETLEHERGPEA